MSLHALSLSQGRLPTECNNKLHLLIIKLLSATCNPEKGLQSAHACAGAAAASEGPNLTSNVHGELEKKRGGDLVLKEAHAETLELLW